MLPGSASKRVSYRSAPPRTQNLVQHRLRRAAAFNLQVLRALLQPGAGFLQPSDFRSVHLGNCSSRSFHDPEVQGIADRIWRFALGGLANREINEEQWQDIVDFDSCPQPGHQGTGTVLVRTH